MSAITLMRGKQSGTKLCFLPRTVRDRRNAWGVRAAYAVVLLCLATAIASPGQTYTTLVNFNKSDGALPESSLIQGFDGKLYGTTNWGPNDNGNVFKVTDSGTLTTLHNFCTQTNCGDGNHPYTAVVQAPSGMFYGTTSARGAHNAGTVFKITANGTLATLYSFCSQAKCADGKRASTLVLGSDGNLYGTTAAGNYDGCGTQGCGTVFKVTRSGVLTTLFSFCGKSTCVDHGFQPMAGLVQGTDGNFYGTTYAGGTNHNGTIFKITPTGNLTTLYSFCAQANCADGAYPLGALVQGADGNFYGTTLLGGLMNSNGCSNGCGTVFKISSGGELTTLHDFCSEANCADGAASAYGPNLIQASDGDFYGTSTATIFKITPQGVLTPLYNTPNSANNLVQASDGNFYGTTAHGGLYNWGTVFRLSVGLGPFVETTPTPSP
ncbi:MAG TPA: choice-of-anchor tandem repeat GloVer-containing protein [Candidatus Acidoferrum sp.]|nr:choice-of-anchor tandem repeat GloVer-containing protein [Candidatus Acidoferrum sp.]